MTSPPASVLLVSFATAVALAFGTTSYAAPAVHDAEASVVPEYSVGLAANESVTFEATTTSAGSAPVLHLLDRQGRQVAIANGTRLSHQAPHAGTYTLVVRARSNAGAGTADLLRNGIRWRTGVRFAGSDLLLPGLRRGERLETVRLPGAAGPTHSLYLLKSDGVGIERRVVGGGVAGAARLLVTGETGTRHVVLGVPRRRVGPLIGSGSTPGPVRLLRNDASLARHDADGDGLGSELERALGTCDSPSSTAVGVRCAAIKDRHNTDGNGISDGLEVRGRRRPQEAARAAALGGEDLALPLWGANPRHKDLFVEVDFMRRSKAENDERTTLRMPPEVARRFADYYGDAMTADPARRAEHAATLKNPDGLPGIAAHLDIGVAPETADDATIYGDWGGFNAVNAMKVGKDDYAGVKAADAWPAQMSRLRRGVFRYALAYGTGGGQTGKGFTASYNFNDPYVAAHETGHSLGLGHSGPMGLDLPADVNCKPNYPSIMNYAYQSYGAFDVGFSDGRVENAPSLNNWSLAETDAVKPSATALLDRLENIFRYRVDRDHGHVDWNRDGEFAPAGSTVRAYANYRPGGGGCEYTRYNQTRLGDAPNPGSPALARLGRRMYAFSVWNRQIRIARTDSWLICPTPAKEGCAGATWQNASAGSPGVGAAGVDAVTIGSGGDRLLLVAMDLDQRLWERTVRLEAGVEHWRPWRRVPGTAVLGGPTLTRTSNGTPYLAYTAPSGQYRVARRSSAGRWATAPFRDPAGATLGRPAGSRFTPSLVEADLGWRPGERRLYALLAAADDKLDLWAHDPGTGRWEKTDLLVSRPGPVSWHPSLAWAPPGSESSIGRLHVVYIARGSGLATMMMSYVQVTSTAAGLEKEQRVGLTGPFDNVWLPTPGFDLLYERGIRTLRALLVRTEGRGLWFRPKADGIQDFRYVNYDDWSVLRENLCRGVVNPGGLVARPVRCG